MKSFWPTPEVLEHLTVSDSDQKGQYIFSAPEGTECAQWLAYYSQTDSLREEFRQNMLAAIMGSLDDPKD